MAANSIPWVCKTDGIGVFMVARPTRSEVQHELLRAAEAVFSEQGYQRASLNQIAERAGFTKGAVYSNFKSKPELYVATCERWIMASVQHLQPRLSAAIEGVDELELIAERLAEVLVEQMPDAVTHQRTLAEFRMLAVHADEVRDGYTTLLERRMAMVEDVLAGHPLTSGYSHERRRNIAFAALTMLTSLTMECVAAPAVVSFSLAREALARCLKGLLA